MSKPESDQKTEAPTAKRRRDATRDGDTLQSRDLATALVMVAGAGWMALAGPSFVAATAHLLKAGLTVTPRDVALFDPLQRMMALVPMALPTMAMLFAATLIAAIAGPATLGSLGFRSGGFAFKPNKLDPLAGLGRIFGAQGLIELGKASLKLALVGAVGWWALSGWLPRLMGLAAMDHGQAAGAVGGFVVTLVLWLVAALAVIGLIDAPIQFVRRAARLRMSRHEVKEELRESDGSPETKLQARQRRHEILNGSARKAVTEASVVLTNPTHFAIALRYRPGKDAAPLVVARGRGDTALAIRALAKGAAVPTLEYPQLTRAIYFTARAGQPIAQDLYIAVATILAFVFNLDRAVAEGLAQPDVTVPTTRRFDERGKRAF